MSQRNLAQLIFPLIEGEGFEAGDARAHQAALAMADRFDAPTIIAVTDALSYLLRIGGQLQMATLREWVGEDGLPANTEDPGEWRTLGMTIFYETRDAKIQRQKPPVEVMGTPVEDFGRAATEVAGYTDVGPEPDPDPEELEQQPEPAAEPVALTD